jgi:hypothetical protein
MLPNIRSPVPCLAPYLSSRTTLPPHLLLRLRAAFASDAEFRSCLQPYPITSTVAIKALHWKACDDMEGYPEPMAGCDTCTRQSCPDPLGEPAAQPSDRRCRYHTLAAIHLGIQALLI